MSDFTQEEEKVLNPFFTNLDKDIFVLTNLPEVVKGALFSRYSRSPKSLRRILLEEFIQIPEMGFSEIVGVKENTGEQLIAIQRAEGFYDRVLVGYGDDSVAELGGAHIALEGISHIASKVVEDARIGISPLEKSTRYVFFDEKLNGQYQYIREPALMASSFSRQYVIYMDMLFDTYSLLIEPLQQYLRQIFPRDSETSDRAYRSTIRAKAADILRGILPAGVKTNVGLYGNGRAFEYLLVKMQAHSLAEIRTVGSLMQQELDKVIPSFVKRAKEERGKVFANYLKETNTETISFMRKLKTPYGRPLKTTPGVHLIEYSDNAWELVLAACLFGNSHQSFLQLKKIISGLSRYKRNQLFAVYASGRQNRHHKIGRALEQCWYTFEVIANYGAYRDLQRHRMLSQTRQDLTTRYGYDVPQELKSAGLLDKYVKAMEQAAVIYEKIAKHYPKEAQYVVPNAYKMRWVMTLNLREVVHLTELRSSPQGHSHYRALAQNIAREVLRVHPWVRPALQFVDWTPAYALERLESEKRIDKKMERLGAAKERVTIG